MRARRWRRSTVLWVLAGLFAFGLWLTVAGGRSAVPETDGVQLAQDVRAGRVERIVTAANANELTVRYRPAADGHAVADRVSRLPDGVTVFDLLAAYRVDLSQTPVVVEAAAPSGWGGLLGLVAYLLPALLLVGFFYLVMRQTQGSSNQALSFGKSRARLFSGNRPAVTFADVAGADEAKAELEEVVEFLKFPEKFVALGARIPRGVLLVGPPGTGKTLLSRAVAGEAGVPFFSISGSEFVEMFVGVGASRVRDLFEQAKKSAPAILFIDEIDAVGRQRGSGMGGSHDEREQTLNQILVEMDGFDSSTNIIMIAATNRPDVLDPALLRPGRFDRQVILDRPDVRGRQAILDVHTRGKPLDEGIKTALLAKQTPGFTGADLENLVNEAAILAARRNKTTIGRSELDEAIDRVVAGPERKSRVISPRERIMTAYHEAGHAVAARLLAYADPVHKISIVARGMMGGYTRYLPDEDRSYYTRSQLEDMLAYMLGGHVAERLVFAELSTGASNDIERATGLARKMVTEYGMSDRLGTIAFGKKEEMLFLGRDLSSQRNYSETVAVAIDDEVKRLIDTAYARATALLETHLPQLTGVVDVLLERETIEGEEIERFFDGPRPLPQLIGPPHTAAGDATRPSATPPESPSPAAPLSPAALPGSSTHEPPLAS